jgi:hypothetical protein
LRRARTSDVRDVVVFDINKHYVLRKPYPFFKEMSSQEFSDKFSVVKQRADGLCLFHCIAYGRREDTRGSQAAAEREEFLRRYRERFKGRREFIPMMGIGSDEEWDDMERRVEHPGEDGKFPNHFAIFMAQEIFNIVIYVWSKITQRTYQVTLGPLAKTDVESPRFILHLLHDREGLHYDVLTPKREYVTPRDTPLTISQNISEYVEL